MAKAWTYQDDKQVKKRGEAKASWYVGWLDPAGKRRCKSCGPGAEGKRQAEKFRDRVQSQLNTGTYEEKPAKAWDDFAKEYEERILDGLEPRTKDESLTSLAHFKRLAKPGRVWSIDAAIIDTFVARRRKEPGKKKGSSVSPATVNKELRQIKAALNVAREWGYLKKTPRIRMERQVKKLARFVTAEHFAAIYQACESATMPKGLPYPASDWWRGLIIFAYMRV